MNSVDRFALSMAARCALAVNARLEVNDERGTPVGADAPDWILIAQCMEVRHMQAPPVKAVAIVVSGAGEDTAEVKDVELRPGLSIREVLDSLGLQDYILSRGRGQERLDQGRDFYNEVRPDDRKFFATPKPDVGC